MTGQTTEIRVDEEGWEHHESWLLIRANKIMTMGVQGGRRLFDSEIAHQYYIDVTVTRCQRKRELNRDRLHSREILMEIAMSQAQWGAFVSSFGNGTGVPATLDRLVGEGAVSQAPPELRFDQSHQEVRDAGEKALESVQTSYERVMEAFESGGKRALREALRDLGIRLQNAPKNMEFAAESLTEHVENVVTKARADIEGMALAASERAELAALITTPQIGSGGSSSE